MTTENRIRTAIERNVKALSRRPSVGQGTAVTKVRARDGLTCEIEEGPWKITVDLAGKSGGNNAGPNPGILGRGALGSCLTMTYLMWAARLGVPISSLEVEIQADCDARGMYGVGQVSSGYSEIRYVVTIESTATEKEVLDLLDTADQHSSYLEVFEQKQSLHREVRLTAPARPS